MAIKIKAKDTPSDVVSRYWKISSDNLLFFLSSEIITRLAKICDYMKKSDTRFSELGDAKLSEEEQEKRWQEMDDSLIKALQIPSGVWGLGCEGRLPSWWIKMVEKLVRIWVKGTMSWDDCEKLIWELGERYDLDQHYILYGIPNRSLKGIEYQYLESFVYEFGMRNSGNKNKI